MAEFADGQRVRVPLYNPGAPSYFYQREGTVKFVSPPQTEVTEYGPAGPVEQQYMVRFDRDDQDRAVWESWLEAVD